MKRAVVRQLSLQRKRLEEPARVREMPFGRTDVRHRLYYTIFRSQTSAQCFGCTPDGYILFSERCVYCQTHVDSLSLSQDRGATYPAAKPRHTYFVKTREPAQLDRRQQSLLRKGVSTHEVSCHNGQWPDEQLHRCSRQAPDTHMHRTRVPARHHPRFRATSPC